MRPLPETVESHMEEKPYRTASCFLRSLPDTERKVFLLRYWHLKASGRSWRDFGFSESKVKSLLHRTRNKLRAELKKEEIAL